MKSKRIGSEILIIVLIIFLSGCTANNLKTGPVSDLTTNNENLRVAEIDLPGMFCQACAQSSESAFRGMVGVVDADVDITTKKETVIYDPVIITKEQIVQDGLIQAYDGKILSDKKYNQ